MVHCLRSVFRGTLSVSISECEAGSATMDSDRRPWEADPGAQFSRRLGKSAHELGDSDGKDGCPDIWELSNGDVAVIGRDLTDAYAGRLPAGVTVVDDERLVVIPHNMIVAAKGDIPDA
jgi:hypothetical protein